MTPNRLARAIQENQPARSERDHTFHTYVDCLKSFSPRTALTRASFGSTAFPRRLSAAPRGAPPVGDRISSVGGLAKTWLKREAIASAKGNDRGDSLAAPTERKRRLPVSLKKRLLPKSAGLGGRIGVQTLVSILGSLALTALLTFLFVGVDSSKRYTVAELWRIGLSISTIAPALICPLIAFRMSKLVRDLRTAHDELADLAGKDTLTGLMNRRGFDAAAVHVFAEARRLGQPIVAIMCDIDMFKDINDRYGHDVGDIVLIDVAQIIRRSVGARSAVLGRQGGDEFADPAAGRRPRRRRRDRGRPSASLRKALRRSSGRRGAGDAQPGRCNDGIIARDQPPGDPETGGRRPV